MIIFGINSLGNGEKWLLHLFSFGFVHIVGMEEGDKNAQTA
jgi:hypothetical protein